MTKAADKIIVALDVPTAEHALRLVDELRDCVSFFKVGLQLYTVCGPQIVREIRQRDAKVFLDLKLHDIPNTVAGAVEAAGNLGIEMLTIHLSGGEDMIRAAVAARSGDMLMLGVTVLTSADAQTLHTTGVAGDVGPQVLRLARLGATAGVDGLVASPLETQNLREEFGARIKLVVPGVRPSGSEHRDQKRVLSPREAIRAGADYLVIGRPITGAPNPTEAFRKIVDEIGS